MSWATKEAVQKKSSVAKEAAQQKKQRSKSTRAENGVAQAAPNQAAN
ncbi:MAG: hypothetical protein QE278_01430 [Limnobacter sp.]|nr:hypothetical protein [Limnobacter sp.]